jgi:drug/metabolite transporter (DMT)-like permease
MRSRFFGLVDLKENSMKRVFTLAFLFASSVAYAQTTAPTTAPPAANDGGGMGWLGFLVLLALIGAAIWYFMKKRGSATTASGVAGVDRPAAGTTTTGTTTGTTGTVTPPSGPNVYSSKDPER